MCLCRSIRRNIDQCEHIDDLRIILVGSNLCHFAVLCESKQSGIDLFTQFFVTEAEADCVGLIAQRLLQEAESGVIRFEEAACCAERCSSVRVSGSVKVIFLLYWAGSSGQETEGSKIFPFSLFSVRQTGLIPTSSKAREMPPS